ncbi:hypothetical protein CBM2599_B50727 [Cupriavidus taiwanensis]|nr:hypothetical protein CBM2599_B50727 [Cupriavidus taiwanensis]
MALGQEVGRRLRRRNSRASQGRQPSALPKENLSPTKTKPTVTHLTQFCDERHKHHPSPHPEFAPAL